jgi:hypothetical protein
MLSIISLLLVVTLSILITRIATIALTHTGLSKQSARFQARSAFTGAGFTTTESEQVVSHPVRRRIVLLLMLLGNAGFVTAVSSLILTFVDQGDDSRMIVNLLLLVAGLTVLWTVATSQWVDARLSSLVDRALRRYTRLDVKDYVSVMHLAGDYRVVELEVEPGDWLAHRTLRASSLADEGILVLGIERPDGAYIGAPRGATQIRPKDRLVVYGRTPVLEELDQRRKDWSGDRRHETAVAEQQAIARVEESGQSKEQNI